LYRDISLIALCPGCYGLLGRRLQGARCASFLTQALNGVHDILLLGKKSISQVGCPFHILIEPCEYIGQHYEPLHAGIPGLFGCCIG
jgi:hypothetical protein